MHMFQVSLFVWGDAWVVLGAHHLTAHLLQGLLLGTLLQHLSAVSKAQSRTEYSQPFKSQYQVCTHIINSTFL